KSWWHCLSRLKSKTVISCSVGRVGGLSRLLCYVGTNGIADVFAAPTQLERSLLRDQLEAAIEGSLEPFGLLRLSVPHRRIHLLEYAGICPTPIDHGPRSMPHH